MNEQAYKPSWLARLMFLFCIGVGVALLLATIRFFPVPDKTNFWDAVFDTGHILIFGLLTVLLLLCMATLFLGRWFKSQYVLSAFVSLGIGLAVEYWQKFNNRSAEFIDVVNDTIGIIAFSMLFAIVDPRWPTPRAVWLRRWWLFFGALLVMILGCIPLFRMTRLYLERKNAIPILVHFDDSWDQQFFYTNHGEFSVSKTPEGWPHSRMVDQVGRFDLVRGRYPGFVVHEPYPNWTGFQAIELDVLRTAESSRTFVFRVHDRFHTNITSDRFRRELELKPGFQTIRISIDEIENGPMLRKLHLQYIDAFALFTPNLTEPETIYVGNVRLTR